jgi:hypothetical protein
VVEDSSQLSVVRRASVDVCVWKRTSGLPAQWLDAASGEADFHHDARNVLARDIDFGRWLVPLGDGVEVGQLRADLDTLLGLWVKLVGDVPLRVQLSTIENQKCPRFHIDNVGLRLLCTYAGPGTEWIAEPALDRDRLRTCSMRDAPLRPGGQVSQVERLDVLIMKGSAWPGNGQRGAVHRSPHVHGQRRLVLTLDTQHPPPAR